MDGLEELKKKLVPLFDSEKGLQSDSSVLDPSDPYTLSDGEVNLLSKSYNIYNINELGLQKCSSSSSSSNSPDEKTFRCASHEMRLFRSIGIGASSVVQMAIHIPNHTVIALKKINIFEKEKRQQLLSEIRTLCEAPHSEGLVQFYGAFYNPESGQINIALEYMDGGSLLDVIRICKTIPEQILSNMVKKLLVGLKYLHGVRHLVHRDIKPANLLVNLKGEAKITDFGLSAGLENSVAMCATFVGTVTYMSPERIRNESYSYPADVWSLGLAIFECATGEFPYSANEGPVNLMLQILDDPSPSLSKQKFSPELCSFVDMCLEKDPLLRPTADQLISHPFIRRYEDPGVDLCAFVQGIFDPVERTKELVDMLTVHYYSLFDGPDNLWHHAKNLYQQDSTFRFCSNEWEGSADIFSQLSSIRRTLAGNRAGEKLVHMVEKLHCRSDGHSGFSIRASGSFLVGRQFPIRGGDENNSRDEDECCVKLGRFQEQFVVRRGSSMLGQYFIADQELYISH
ncbi:hypothetical protein M569_06666 [Genlisea aurea]|uniref:mitogen-activated protein kinase kinase n=1 Tax=Genlisea aurea TaxID=192259 RepID=S8DXV3_9LAMI|nr:hypothetical protein M569_06666 [Genlisea aurea]